MVGDLFKPTDRGKVLSLLLLAQPFAFVAGTILQNMFELGLGWRAFLILLGAIAFLITLMIHLYMGEPKRGAKEPALANVAIRGTYVFGWDTDKRVLIKPSLVLLFGLIFFGTIPVIFLLESMPIYLRDVHNLVPADVLVTLLPAMVGAVLAYPIGGFLGDLFFKRNKLGRLLPCLFGFFVPPVSLYLALRLGDVPGQRFLVYILLVSYFVALTLPNLVAMIMDITLPEIRGSACALGLFFQTLTFLITPIILSIGQTYLPISALILWVCISAWVIGLGLIGWLFIRIPKDIEDLRRHMAYRSMLETRLTQLEK